MKQKRLYILQDTPMHRTENQEQDIKYYSESKIKK
jgi:hypothetical protein